MASVGWPPEMRQRNRAAARREADELIAARALLSQLQLCPIWKGVLTTSSRVKPLQSSPCLLETHRWRKRMSKQIWVVEEAQNSCVEAQIRSSPFPGLSFSLFHSKTLERTKAKIRKKLAIMRSQVVFLSLASGSLAGVFERAACNADNCARAVTGTRYTASIQALHTADCSSFMIQTITPATPYVRIHPVAGYILTLVYLELQRLSSRPPHIRSSGLIRRELRLQRS